MPVRRLRLLRARSTDQGTPGALLREDGSRLAWTMELPWRDNARQISSIPPGEYVCRVRRSPHFGPVYEVTAVPNRTNVLVHPGNYGGDRAKGFPSDVLGCVVLGLHHGVLRGQLAVFVSRPAVSLLMREMQGAPFTLEIRAWTPSAALAA